MLKILLLSLASLLFAAEGTVLTVNDNEYSLHAFYSRYPKKQWERADSLQKDKMFADFIKRELCILEAKRLGLQNDPNVAVKIRDRSLQVLVNESYEHFVAAPLIPLSELDAAIKDKYGRNIIINLISLCLVKVKNMKNKNTVERIILLS